MREPKNTLNSRIIRNSWTESVQRGPCYGCFIDYIVWANKFLKDKEMLFVYDGEYVRLSCSNIKGKLSITTPEVYDE